MSKWVKCIRADKYKGVITIDKKYEVELSVDGKYKVLTDVDENWIIEESYFTPCDPPEEEQTPQAAHPTPLKPSDPVPEYCYHVTNKAIKHDKCSFVKTRQSDGTCEEYILLDHGGKREFGDTYASLEDAVIIAKQLWGIEG